MATRKIRLTMSGTKVDNQGPIVDVDFNGTNLDADVDVNAVHGESTIVKEYTVDVDSGTYVLSVDFKNDLGGEGDRNLYLDKIEFANDGSNFEYLQITGENTNVDLSTFPNEYRWGFVENPAFDPDQPVSNTNSDTLLNPDFDPSQPRTDDVNNGWVRGTHPGNNPKNQVKFVFTPVALYNSGVYTFNISFS